MPVPERIISTADVGDIRNTEPFGYSLLVPDFLYNGTDSHLTVFSAIVAAEGYEFMLGCLPVFYDPIKIVPTQEVFNKKTESLYDYNALQGFKYTGELIVKTLDDSASDNLSVLIEAINVMSDSTVRATFNSKTADAAGDLYERWKRVRAILGLVGDYDGFRVPRFLVLPSFLFNSYEASGGITIENRYNNYSSDYFMDYNGGLEEITPLVEYMPLGSQTTIKLITPDIVTRTMYGRKTYNSL